MWQGGHKGSQGRSLDGRSGSCKVPVACSKEYSGVSSRRGVASITRRPALDLSRARSGPPSVLSGNSSEPHKSYICPLWRQKSTITSRQDGRTRTRVPRPSFQDPLRAIHPPHPMDKSPHARILTTGQVFEIPGADRIARGLAYLAGEAGLLAKRVELQ